MTTIRYREIDVDNVVTRGIIRDIRAYNGSLSDALTDIGSTECTLLIAEPIEVGEDLTVPENVVLKVLRGCPITVTTDVNLTINSPIEAGLYQIFDGNGNISFSDNVVVIPQWFGVLGEGTDALVINKAIQSNASVFVPPGSYSIEEPIDFTPWVNTNYKFFEARGTRFVATSNLDQLVNLAPSSGQLLHHKFTFGVIDGNKTSYTVGSLVKIRCMSDCIVNILLLQNGSGNGLLVDQYFNPAYSCTGNLISVGTITDNNGSGLALRADASGTKGIEGNIFDIGKITSNGGDGLLLGQESNVRTVYNILRVGVISQNGGCGCYIKSGTNQVFIGNSNNNTDGGIASDSNLDNSCFIVGGFDDSISETVNTEHTVLNTTIENGGFGAAWNENHIKLSGYHLWVDGSGNLRIKSGKPTSDTDGTIVGTQT